MAGETKLPTGLRFDNVSFGYPSRPGFSVIRNLSFTIEPGQSLAIVGPSGAGKSTLVNLIYRFYTPNEGAIFMGDENISDTDLFKLRSNLALVPQEIILFGGSIAENIRYGKPGASDEEVKEAAQKANAHDFISSFPEGYQTIVGDRGIRLSGGQRQRIAIARAILRNPNLLILDEATSSLDTESEQQVQAALSVLMKNRTSIIIAHRLSTIRHANQIIVLKAGSIAENGSHEELMSKENGIYRRMVEKQVEPEDFFNNQV
jgi:ABC-type multidrug transport system fused ATPase/permease subunit